MHPFVAAHVCGRIDALTFDQLVKLLGRAFERHPANRISTSDTKHLIAYRETQIGAPFYVLGSTGQRKTEFSELFNVHTFVFTDYRIPR